MKLSPILEKYRQRVEESLKEYFESCSGPDHLIEAMSYSLFAGGKRIRPVLLLATSRLFARESVDPMPAACAFEFIHTYSLIHDDLPAIDNDDLRRGRPTSHIQFGEAQAILAGDGLLTEAFGLMSRFYCGTDDMAVVDGIAELAVAAGSAGMVGGQVLDIVNTGNNIDQNELEHVHRLKTGALIRAAVRCGAILGHADPEELESLTRYAEQIGLAFQVADDILDVVGTRERLGKSAGKDLQQGKTTYASLMGIENSKTYLMQLTEQAKTELDKFGEKAEPLRAIASFIAGSILQAEN
ncbi:MAG: polyprenyl synthetase family protein [Deltaproteobacteria bacterium]|nr:polyprenyl synthetase family protein [Deltaproteobacteria bacterium]